MKGALAHAPPGPAADFPTGSSHRVLFFFFFSAKMLNENHRESTENPVRIPNLAYPFFSTKQTPIIYAKRDETLSLSLLVTRNKENTRRCEK